ncbi:MAG TPA: NAD(+)--rifampin ADP-ribosyltransferase [Lachnospiraceae bacterium]|nr:NAD(+)--rifampin ADP-ribosyltransferase [Lachnospiraceae bacterium]
MSETIIFSQGSFFHGTKADLKVGDFIITGKKKNYNDDRESKYVYFAGTLEAAIWGAELAEGDGKERIYVVEPTGDYENDPNLTDKKFPGNPTKSYRSKQPLKIVAEVIKWEGHSPEILNNMIENLRKLSEDGIKAIDE